ncbi:uncharacterized protein LOC131183152 [Hevea brasiliensis]|uniref:uncharacterized protein LOC131183152 n=1 Tax=Hevea brasiliensis TaxID=3981 RepID=UPI0025D4DB64|nr:uncharacterized protein LOC131183152 [Hevea brasiliensis]
MDFRDINAAIPKDVCVMLVADMLIDGTIGHELLSFMDIFFGYNQILTAKEDDLKIAFRCQGTNLIKYMLSSPLITRRVRIEGHLEVNEMEIKLWVLKFDDLRTKTSTEAGILIKSPTGTKIVLSFNLDFECINNQVEYEVLLIGLEI